MDVSVRSIETRICSAHLLSISFDVLQHIKFNILERCALSNLPMDPADVSRLIGARNINFEVLDTPEEVIRVKIPVCDNG